MLQAFSISAYTYADVVRIVRSAPVAPARRSVVPAALPDERIWKDRSTLAIYSSSPALGK